MDVAYSEYSSPMTRQSSAAESTPVHTPEDDLMHFMDRKMSGMRGPRNANPPPPPTRALNRNKSTKQLITRFESLSENPDGAATRRSAIVPPQDLDHPKTLPPPPVSASNVTKDKGHSPIRSSFRNLFSVFKKGKPPKDPGKDSSDPSDPPPFSGTLLYLTRPLSGISTPAMCATPSSALPVWTTCTASLEAGTIHVSWPGLVSTRIIPLSKCADVRSLSLRQMPEEELALLPRASKSCAQDDLDTIVEDELRVFEIVFDHGGTEKFAATSVQERASWVSAIWDAVLPNQSQMEAVEAVPPPVTTSSLNPDRELPPTPPFEPPTAQEHPLPELPSNFARIALHDSPVPPPILSPIAQHHLESPALRPKFDSPDLEEIESRRRSRFTSTRNNKIPLKPRMNTLTAPKADSPTKSTSIANLAQLSMVRQRLAQIEPTTSQSPTQVPMLFMPSPMAPVRADSSRSDGMDSILHSYGDELSPPDHRPSARPVVLPPTQPLFSRTKPTPTIPSLHIPSSLSPGGLQSPVSQYSNSARSSLGVGNTTATRSSFARGGPMSNSAGLPQTHSPIPHSPLGPTASPLPRPSSGPDPTTLDLLHSHHAALDSKLTTLTTGLSKLRSHLTSIVSLHPKHPLLEHVGQSVHIVQETTHNTALYVKDIRDMLGEIGEGMRSQNGVLGERLGRNGNDLRELGRVVTELREGIDGLRATQANADCVKGKERDKEEEKEKSEISVELALMNERKRAAALADAMALDQVHVKLDGLLEIIRAQEETKREIPVSAVQPKPVVDERFGEELKDISRMLRNDRQQREDQGRQQADSIRYLSELNTWIESFVQNGTGQMQIVSSGVQKLCKQLGTDEKGGNSLLAGIHQIIADGQHRDRNSASLQSTINKLTEIVQEDRRESRNVCTRESMAGLMERQRQDQEEMLRTLAMDLSNEIRGERLRFVEAMKEATAVNIQQHLQDFKTELRSEVLSATDTLGRLSMERQALELEIASLFEVYSKQKQMQQPAPLTRQSQSHAGYLSYQTPATPTYGRSHTPGARTLPIPHQSYGR